MIKPNIAIVVVLSTLITYCVGVGDTTKQLANANEDTTTVCDCPEPPPVEFPPPQVTTLVLETTLDDTGAGWVPLPDFDPENPPSLSHWEWAPHPDQGDHWRAQGHRGRVYLTPPAWAPDTPMPALYFSDEVPNSFRRIVVRYVKVE
jgi:hypothetical protein